MERKYNFIYEQLVISDDDLVGLVAYGIYKKHKIEFISKIKAEEHRDPTEDECRSFFAASTTESQLTKYRSEAESILSETVARIAKDEIDNFEKDMLKGYRHEISACLPSNWKTFGVSVLSGVVSAFLFSLIAAAFFFMGETSERTTRDNTKQIMEHIQTHPTDSADVSK